MNVIRRIIQIDEEKCNGCGACAAACHEGAIGMVDGKAKLLRDNYCDGLGDCLPTCPTGAISFVEREAAAYDEKAVQEHMRKQNEQGHLSAAGHSVFSIHRRPHLPLRPRPFRVWDNGPAKSGWLRSTLPILTGRSC